MMPNGGECGSRRAVLEPVITKHPTHICFKPPGHKEECRCWACGKQWPRPTLAKRDDFGG